MQTSPLTISSMKRDHGRVHITLSNGDTLFMPRAMLKERPYKSGMPFDRSAHEAFIHSRAYSFALAKAVTLLAARARTEHEIADALRKNAYPETVIARVMARLQKAGYIDDADFASRWAASRASKGLGVRRISMELRQKGVAQEAIDSVVTAMDKDNLYEGALKAAQKAARGKNLALPADRQKVLTALARRGFDFTMAKRALQQVVDEL